MKIIFYFLLIIALISCNRDENSLYIKNYDWKKKEYALSDFIPLSVGNYWIYNTYQVDTMGKDSLISTDTLRITETKYIRGLMYYKLFESRGFGSENSYFRYICDSAGYLLYDNGQVGFSTVNFSDTLRIIDEPGVSRAAYIMKKEPEEVNVPAGKFSCLNYVAYVKLDKAFQYWDNPGKYCNYYAPGIGKVKSTAFYLSKPYILERRLVKYSINK